MGGEGRREEGGREGLTGEGRGVTVSGGRHWTDDFHDIEHRLSQCKPEYREPIVQDGAQRSCDQILRYWISQPVAAEGEEVIGHLAVSTEMYGGRARSPAETCRFLGKGRHDTEEWEGGSAVGRPRGGGKSKGRVAGDRMRGRGVANDLRSILNERNANDRKSG